MHSRAKTNILTIADNCCSCGKWQEYKYACMHAMAYLWKWEQLEFPTIFQYHVHDYYQFERLQQIYDSNIFTVIQDQIWYDGKNSSTKCMKKQAGNPKKKWFRK